MKEDSIYDALGITRTGEGELGAPAGIQRSDSSGERRKDGAGGYPAHSRMEPGGVSSDGMPGVADPAVQEPAEVTGESGNERPAAPAAQERPEQTGEERTVEETESPEREPKEAPAGTRRSGSGDLERAISESPTVRRMQEILRREEEARRERDMAAAQAKIDAELREIHRLDPSITTTEDLLNMPAAKEFYEYVRRGNTFLDAFYLANRQRLTEQAAQAARQQTLNAARSKDHLHPAGTSRGEGAATVPAEELKLFKLLNPQATEAEIQTYYNRSQSK